jgi:hypothetical protein
MIHELLDAFAVSDTEVTRQIDDRDWKAALETIKNAARIDTKLRWLLAREAAVEKHRCCALSSRRPSICRH